MSRAFAKRAKVSGFRPGHVPEPLVQQRFAGEIREEVIERLLPAALSTAIQERPHLVLPWATNVGLSLVVRPASRIPHAGQ